MVNHATKEIGEYLPQSYSFALLNGITLLLVYFKLEASFNADWELIAGPTFIFLVWRLIRASKCLLAELLHEEDLMSNVVSQIIMVGNAATIIFSFVAGYLILTLVDVLEAMNQPGITMGAATPASRLYTIIAVALVMYFIYTWLMNHLKEVHTAESETILPLHHNASHTFGFISTAMNTLFSMLTSLMTTTFFVCSGGSCHTLYMSTASSFFSALGLSVLDWMPYLNGLTFLFLGIGLFSLYIKNRTFWHGPFQLGLIATTAIVVNILFYESRILLYGGNIVMIGASIWNAKISQPTLAEVMKAQKSKSAV